MTFLPLDHWLENVSDIIHADTQQHENHLDLTVHEIHKIKRPGSLDFGGSEFEPAELEHITPKKNAPNDDYGWWKLEAGEYKIVFNETLNSQENSAMISAHHHTSEAGIIASTIVITPDENPDPLSMNVRISEAGCNIKENARIAELRMIE